MEELALHFSGSERVELTRVRYSSAEQGISTFSVRGKCPGAYLDAGTFQWTPAVRALCLLLVRSATRRGAEAVLEGERGSLALSLDYALSKEPSWLREMFGPLAKRLFVRTNSDLRLPGPVAVRLNIQRLQRSAISIFLDGKRVTDDPTLLSVANSLLAGVLDESLAFIDPHSQITLQSQLNGGTWIVDVAMREAVLTLGSVPIFDRFALTHHLRKITSAPYFESLAGRARGLISEADLSLARHVRLCTVEDECKLRALSEERPIRIALPFSGIAALTICEYLKQIKGVCLEVDLNYGYAIQILHKIMQDAFVKPPDLIVLGIAPAGTLLGASRKTGYRPLSLLPCMSHRVLERSRPGRRPKLRTLRYCFLRDDPSTSLFYLEDMLGCGEIDARAVERAHCEPWEIATALQTAEPGTRVISFFPYSELHLRDGGVRLVDRPVDGTNLKDVVLFASDEFLANSPLVGLFHRAYRDAWLELQSNKGLLKRLVTAVSLDPKFRKALGRFSGATSGITA